MSDDRTLEKRVAQLEKNIVGLAQEVFDMQEFLKERLRSMPDEIYNYVNIGCNRVLETLRIEHSITMKKPPLQ